MAEKRVRKVVHAKVEWKSVSLNAECDSYDGLAGIEELTDYEIVTTERKRKRVDQEEDFVSEHVFKKNAKEDVEDIASDDDVHQRKKKKKKKQSVKKFHRTEVGTLETNKMDEEQISDAELQWRSLLVPEVVIQALIELGYSSPTAIQSLSLPSAIRDQRDIVGAAETGSGKTLAFGIPIIHKILQLRENAKNDVISEHVEEDFKNDDESEDLDSSQNTKASAGPAPKALVLTPTRELAIQVKNHLQAAAKYTDIKVIAVVGGIAPQKQRRLLSRHPEIIVATPGRLWEHYEEGHLYLRNIMDINCLVIDEADRMLEKGHFAELSQILDVINSNENVKQKRQTFIFSATLTMVHDIPLRMLMKKKKKKYSDNDKLVAFAKLVGVKDNPKIVDITSKTGTAEMLVEAQLNCPVTEKDYYLYYFLVHHPGRTLVFCNSIDCVRRLISIFTLLKRDPLPLHSDMHQKQRLKNLERFAANEKGLVIATDVAARGLDIPRVQHVVHYQIPRVSETYVHRSGRTARACKEGLSVLIISPEEIASYRRICHTLKREEDLPLFPISEKVFLALKERVNLARQLDEHRHHRRKVQSKNSWFREAAEKMDLEVDDDLLSDSGDEYERSQATKQQKNLERRLASLLKQTIFPRGIGGKFPTKSGKLVLPHIRATTEALTLMKESASQQRQLFKSKGSLQRKTKQRLRNQKRKRNSKQAIQ